MRAFVAVADELHFGRAALALGLSQPQVSRQVASLERSLGVTLLRRTPRQVGLTQAGAELVSAARDALEAVERVKRRARPAARGALGTVSVGFVWSTLPAYLPALVAATAGRHPQIELTVSQVRVTDIVPMLRRGDIDLAITRGHLGECEMIVETLNAEPGVVAIPESHPLARRETIEEADLHGERFITLARETIPLSFDIVRARLEQLGIRPSGYRAASARRRRWRLSPPDSGSITGCRSPPPRRRRESSFGRSGTHPCGRCSRAGLSRPHPRWRRSPRWRLTCSAMCRAHRTMRSPP